MRVDNLPFLLRLPVAVYGAAVAIAVRILLLVVRATCRISVEGHAPEGPVIYGFWHDRLLLYFMVFCRGQGRQVWMNHPLWYMKPVHFTLLRFMNVERLALGSTGERGREALDQVVGALREGLSTTITPDGPGGPQYLVKPGVLVMSRSSRAPIVGIQFSVSRSFRLPSWDHKIVPMPFARIVVRYSDAVVPTRGTARASALSDIAEALGPAGLPQYPTGSEKPRLT